MKLSYAEYGDGPVLLVLHGLFGSARNWNTVATRLAENHRVYALDLRNHGNSPWAETMSYYDLAEDVGGFIEEHQLRSVAVLGHSMGGKTAMVLALEHGHLVDRLIVVDIAPVAYGGSDLESYVRTMQGVTLDGLKRRDEVEAQLRDTVEEAGIRSFLMQNLVYRDQHFEWRINLRALASNFPQLVDFPAAAETRVYEGRTLFLSGRFSDYVRPDHHPAIRRMFPKAEFEVIDDAGHWVHADQSERLVERVLGFLQDGGSGR
jgi:pimeloyl-ACP methyl ester carboxylesterase